MAAFRADEDKSAPGEAGGDQNGLTIYAASRFANSEPKPRRFVDGFGFFPCGELAYLSGAGGIGKTLLGMQLLASVCLPESIYPDAHWLGRPVGIRGNAVFVSAEEDEDELDRRFHDIAAAQDGFSLRDISRLKIIDLEKEPDRALFREGKRNVLVPTRQWQRLENTLLSRAPPALIVIDNRVQIAEFDQLNASLATQVGMRLRGLAREFDAAVIVLAHPSQAGLNSGTGTSGSLGWTNAARAHIVMQKPKKPQGQKDDEEPDEDDGVRQLVNQKANYSRMGAVVNLKWDEGRYVCTDKAPRAGDDIGKADRAERVFLALLRKSTERMTPVTNKPKSRNYAPKVFADNRRDREGVNLREFESAMEALFQKDRIQVVPDGSPSSKLTKLIIVEREV